MSEFDVIIIGGGMSGLLSALTLGKHGKSVLLLEKSSAVGGNCNSYVVDGFQVDTGVHAITHLQAGPLRRLIDNYFDFMPVFIDHGTYYVRTEKGLSKIPSNLKEFATFDVLPKVDTLLLSQAITKAITLNTFGVDLSNQSVYDNIPKNLSQDTFNFVDAMCYSLSGKSMKETSVNRILTGTSFLRDRVPEHIFETQPQPSPPLPGIAGKIVEQISISQLASHLTSLGRLATNRIAYAQAYPRGG
ncbi:MAG TPA: NAD(P)/FAD-dependent oxidoreductase, partial [Candidatus Methanoperedenaceae archaeon]|nr:NAD(P)/FAD-dependent oxidoreductase [Candidatus Methanoperedenaceae archaeon]